MSKIILVTGGSRSGKSKFAEDILKDEDDVLYIATAKAYDDEMKERIKKHKMRRKETWTTYEGHRNLDGVIKKFEGKNVMLDCITIMCTNIMFDECKDFDNITNEQIESINKTIKLEISKLISECRKKDLRLVMVTNEIGCGIVPENKLSRIFRDTQGTINQFIASLCDEVYMVACGLPLKLK